MGDETDDDGPELLVRVDALWTRWAPLTKEPAEKQPWRWHELLLERLLDDHDGHGPGALRHVPETGEMESAWDMATYAERKLVEERIRGSYPEEPSWSTPESIAADRRRVVEGLRWCCEAMTRREPVRDTPLEAATNLYAHRVYLSGRQLERLVRTDRKRDTHPRPEDEPSGLHACIDFRVRSHLGNFWLYATLSLWSSRPRSVEHAPQTEGAGRGVSSRAGEARSVRALCGTMERWRNAFKDLLLSYYLTVEPAVLRENDTASFRRKYRPPRFWVVRCHHHEPGEPCVLVDELCRAAFGAPAGASDVVTEVLENSDDVGRGDSVALEVRRRLQHLTEGAVPAYVIAPISVGGTDDEVRQEKAVRTLVQRLTVLETKIAADLLDITTDLDIEGRFAEVYGAVVSRASELWDQLAMRLPLARGAELGELHQLIELVHLTLLQGLADLGYSKAKVAELLTRLDGPDEGEIDLSDTFVGTRDNGGGSLAESLRTGGYIGRTRSWASQVVARSTFALEHYTSLLDAISKAFDERRVRDTDRIGAVGLGLAATLGLIGFLTETYGALLPEDRDWWLAGALAAWLVVVGVLARTMWNRVSRLGSLASTDTCRRRTRR
ncbi:hypothetical protein PHK61_26530 [Actinomycetospora lutea]|uniref:hypothetical protein n=1 Tax=Actinomycetospora lutea TaxID=663604 RepID=UPI002365760C|nr:hypothetical protein [Actinomycetospora lutea]MDD7941977.1 hypothetical protein [Actinomycetospora lutea]